MRRVQNNRFEALAIGDTRLQGMRPKRQYYLIVCEGEQTEPNYFRALSGSLVGGQADRVVVVGAADNTLNLVTCAEREMQERMKEMLPPFQQIWIVFDRDSFPADDFDNAIRSIEGRSNWHAAWSNEAFELWYLYHFKDECGGGISRDRFKAMLSELLGETYRKNSREMFAKLKPYTHLAIERARRAAMRWPEDVPFHDRNPATMVWALVMNLVRYS